MQVLMLDDFSHVSHHLLMVALVFDLRYLSRHFVLSLCFSDRMH